MTLLLAALGLAQLGPGGDFFGGRVHALGDVDGDGASDLAIRDGKDVWLVSGRIGAVIERNPEIELPPVARGDDGRFVLGDLTGDGIPEVAERDYAPLDDKLRIRDGATGLSLGTIEDLDEQHTCLTAYLLGDVDGDGTRDFAVGEVRALGAGSGPGNVRVFSGRARAVLYTLDRHRAQLLHRTSLRRELAFPRPDSLATGPDRFGVSVARVDDLDGDGIDEVAVGGEGEVWIFSGLDGKPAAVLTGNARFGHVVCGAGDVDGDGTSDLLVGSGREPVDSDAVYVEVRSGRNGSILNRIEDPELDTHHDDLRGAHVAAAPDLDGDGRTEFIAGDRVYSGATGEVLARYPGAGLQVAGLVDEDDVLDFVALPRAPDGGPARVVVYSGADGTVVRRFPHDVAARIDSSRARVRTFAPLPDLDGDLTPEVAVSYGRAVQVYSGLGWRLGLTEASESGYANRVVALGDLDGDRRAEILVTRLDPDPSSGPDSFRVLSGKDGGVLVERTSPLGGPGSLEPARLGDLDLDGVDDFAVGFTLNGGTGAGYGVVRVYSGATRSVLYVLRRPV